MDELKLKEIYNMFYTTKEKGTGLGIPLSIQILRRNNCDVSIESEFNEFTSVILKFLR